MTESGNIFGHIPLCLPTELFETLAHKRAVRIERILSHGQATPEGTWYDQDQDEWVLLLAGSAGLFFEGEPEPHSLMAGDYIMIPARRRHRVAWTSTNETTIWLAVHIDG